MPATRLHDRGNSRSSPTGKIHTVLIMNYPSPWECKRPGQPVPEWIDWNAWCGPSEPVPFHQDIYVQRSNPGWISFRPWSGGEMTGTGAHGFDQIQWARSQEKLGDRAARLALLLARAIE